MFSNMLNINKNIKSQFNILRISDYHNFPTLFNYKGYLYKIRIEKFKFNEKEKTKKNNGFDKSWDKTYKKFHLSVWPWSDLISYSARYLKPKKV